MRNPLDSRLSKTLLLGHSAFALAACSSLLNLRDDYQLANDAGGTDVVQGPDGAMKDATADVQFSEASADASGIAAPRQLGPMTTATTSIQAPTLYWSLPSGVEGAHVDLCADRDCKTIVTQFDAAGTSGKVPMDLPPKLYF